MRIPLLTLPLCICCTVHLSCDNGPDESSVTVVGQWSAEVNGRDSQNMPFTFEYLLDIGSQSPSIAGDAYLCPMQFVGDQICEEGAASGDISQIRATIEGAPMIVRCTPTPDPDTSGGTVLECSGYAAFFTMLPATFRVVDGVVEWQ